MSSKGRQKLFAHGFQHRAHVAGLLLGQAGGLGCRCFVHPGHDAGVVLGEGLIILAGTGFACSVFRNLAANFTLP